jgi:beta-lactamase superfamily II metal-dependent hydrolase
MSFELPKRGLVFWPVANGDSTTIVIDSKTLLQVDLNHLEKSEDDGDPTWSVVDELVKRLPKKDGRPYLSAFALTHPDQDHCRGFAKLLDDVDIGELWFTPRVFREYKKDLCDDAKAFKKEADRRVKKTIDAKGDPGAGHRVRIIGYSDLLNEDKFKKFPEDRITVPGNELTTIDEQSVSSKFRAFVHAPFKDDDAGDRNDTSLGMQVTLYDGSNKLRALLFGDLSYPIIRRIFQVSKADDLAWNVLLAPHHCSKAVMYWKDEGDDEEKLKKHIVDEMDAASKSPNRIVSSSNTVPSSNKPGDNPPHAKAKTQYESITTSFVCTMDNDNPIVAKLEDETISFAAAATTLKSASEAASAARGSNATPGDAVTYGGI